MFDVVGGVVGVDGLSFTFLFWLLCELVGLVRRVATLLFGVSAFVFVV